MARGCPAACLEGTGGCDGSSYAVKLGPEHPAAVCRLCGAGGGQFSILALPLTRFPSELPLVRPLNAEWHPSSPAVIRSENIF